ncbi:Spirocyclase AveC-like protein [compost metagenome]
MFLFLGWHALVRPWLRDGVPSLDGKLFLGGTFASTLDIFFHSFNPTWAMNAYAWNYGTWANFIPGFPGAAANEVPWGLLWCLPAYIWLGVGAAIVGCDILRRLRAAFPRLNTVAMYCIVQLTFMALFFCLATFWNRTEVYTYVSVPQALSVWYGETYQMPLYEPFCIAAYCLAYTWLRDGTDSNGRCAVDRDVDRLHAGRFAKELFSTLAVCGVAAVITMACYQIPFTWLSMTGDSHPKLPSYLQSGLYCGQPGKPQCPGQYLKQLKSAAIRPPAR